VASQAKRTNPSCLPASRSRHFPAPLGAPASLFSAAKYTSVRMLEHSPDVPCISIFSAAKYTSVRMLEHSPDVPCISISFHAQNAFQAGKCAPHLLPSSWYPIQTARLRRVKTPRGTLCPAKYPDNPPMFTISRGKDGVASDDVALRGCSGAEKARVPRQVTVSTLFSRSRMLPKANNQRTVQRKIVGRGSLCWLKFKANDRKLIWDHILPYRLR